MITVANRIHDLPGMRFSDAVDTDDGEVEARVAVPQYFTAYEAAFQLPVYRPVTVTFGCRPWPRILLTLVFPLRLVLSPSIAWFLPAAHRLPARPRAPRA
jgi:hypothetical protein